MCMLLPFYYEECKIFYGKVGITLNRVCNFSSYLILQNKLKGFEEVDDPLSLAMPFLVSG